MSEKSPGNLIARLTARDEAPPWSIGEMVLALVMLTIGTILIGGTIASSVSTDSSNPDPSALILSWLIGLVIAGAFIVIRWRRWKEKFDALALSASNWSPLLALMIGVGAAFSAGLVAGLATGDFGAVAAIAGVQKEQIGQMLLAALFVVIVAPVVEGLIFYGIVLPGLRASPGGLAGLLVTVALYTAYYYLLFGTRLLGNPALWYGIIYPLIICLPAAAVRVWSASTRTAIFVQIGAGISVMVFLLVA